MSFPAQYRGICGDCEQPIQVGEFIVLAGGAGYVHENCPTITQRKPAEVCQTCFIEKPCECDD